MEDNLILRITIDSDHEPEYKKVKTHKVISKFVKRTPYGTEYEVSGGREQVMLHLVETGQEGVDVHKIDSGTPITK